MTRITSHTSKWTPIYLLHTDKTAEAVLLHVLKTAFPASFFAHLSPASTEASAETESGPKLA